MVQVQIKSMQCGSKLNIKKIDPYYTVSIATKPNGLKYLYVLVQYILYCITVKYDVNNVYTNVF